jgi:hemerythrin
MPTLLVPSLPLLNGLFHIRCKNGAQRIRMKKYLMLALVDFEITYKLQEGRMGLTWSKRMSIGNETIDSEHKLILDLVNGVDSAIRTRDEALIGQALDVLEEATRAHFENEERIALAINFPFDEHNLEHRYILDELQVIKQKIADNQGEWSESVAEYCYMFLSTWATEHIMQDDMKMKPLLEAYPYDYKPDDLE